jgi:hypothetical protein
VPSKALIASARLAHAMRHAGELGLRGAAPAHAFAEVMARMRAARARVAHHDDPERFRALGPEPPSSQGTRRVFPSGPVSPEQPARKATARARTVSRWSIAGLSCMQPGNGRPSGRAGASRKRGRLG